MTREARMNGPRPTLASLVREQLGLSWEKARERCRRGQVTVDGEVVLDPANRPREGAAIEITEGRPRIRAGHLDPDRVLYFDRDVVVVDKPADMLTMPYDEGDRDTLVDQTRATLRKLDKGFDPDLGVVQRLDKGTSGVIVFARSLAAKRHLQQQLRERSVDRVYFALVYGQARDARHESYLVANRGDGLRGSHGVFRRPKGGPPREARYALTEVRVVERFRGASLVECRLGTGRQHQIRIHMAEDGNPLLGENVYIREHEGPVVEASRPMLHAARLAFTHPKREERMDFERAWPEDFETMRRELARRRP
jgi:23S rRNA pseudouridine1911/1915/1917 synthase